MEYDRVIEQEIDEFTLKYGIIDGNETIFYIKVGQNGSIIGEKDKYIKIAKDINENYGFTVIVASNPYNLSNPLANDMYVISEYKRKRNLEGDDIYFMGYSNGALVGSLYGSKYKNIKRMLLINPPIQEDAFDGLKEFNGEFVTFIYGDLDYSYPYLIHLFPYLNEKIGLELIEDADHHFKGMDDVFSSLPEKYLLTDIKKLTK